MRSPLRTLLTALLIYALLVMGSPALMVRPLVHSVTAAADPADMMVPTALTAATVSTATTTGKTVAGIDPHAAIAGHALPHFGALPSGLSAMTPHRRPLSGVNAATQAEPPAVDLSAYDPPVGDQGGVGSCVSWATGYYLRGWLANAHSGIVPQQGGAQGAILAPMYLYSQIARGYDGGSSVNENMAILASQGIDTQAEYFQGTMDYTTQPTAQEQSEAAANLLSSFVNVWQNDQSYGQPNTANGGAALRAIIEQTIAGGLPVVLALPVYANFEGATAQNPLIGPPSGAFMGWHAVFAPSYDQNGVWISNSWGTWWAKNGWAELSWAYVSTAVFEAWTGGSPVMPPTTVTPAPYNTVTSVPTIPLPTLLPATLTPVPATPVPTSVSATPIPATSVPTSIPPPVTSSPAPTGIVPTTATPVVPPPVPSPTAAVTPPVVSEPQITITSLAAGYDWIKVSWSTDERATTVIDYDSVGVTGSRPVAVIPYPQVLETTHTLYATNVRSGHYQVFAQSTDAQGRTTTSLAGTVRIY